VQEKIKKKVKRRTSYIPMAEARGFTAFSGKLILASKSKARRALLKRAGFRFSVAESRVKEKRVLKARCCDLVIENALKKAKDVAGRFRKGVVIGADTVVLADGKIIGKPRDKKDAVRTLKLLSKKPRWVYTGLAVVDIDKSTVYKGYEKTKVCMRKLSDADINEYLKKTSVKDKAGSFDIQGRGAKLVDHIEGCYYNVVGMPMVKLKKLLKKSGIDI